MASSHPFIHRSPDLQHLRKDGFGERAAGGVINLMGCCVGPTPLCSLEEDTGTHRSQGTLRKDHVGTREVAVRKARGKAAWEPALAAPGSRPSGPRTVRKRSLLFTLPGLWHVSQQLWQNNTSRVAERLAITNDDTEAYSS